MRRSVRSNTTPHSTHAQVRPRGHTHTRPPPDCTSTGPSTDDVCVSPGVGMDTTCAIPHAVPMHTCHLSFHAQWRTAPQRRCRAGGPLRLLLLLGRLSKVAVACDDDAVVALIRLQSQLLERLELLSLELDDLLREDMLGRGGRVDAVGLHGDDGVALVLEEQVRVERHPM